MAIENFEGKNIQDTFQRVVQTDETNQLANGTGSIFIPVSSSHAITSSHALFAVSASHEITFELSSSHAVSADTASFATNFTASGDISASKLITSTLAAGDDGSDKIILDQQHIQIIGGDFVGDEKIFIEYFDGDDGFDKVNFNPNSRDIDYDHKTDNSRAFFINAGSDQFIVGNSHNNFQAFPLLYSNAVENRFTSTVNIANYGFDSASGFQNTGLDERFPEFNLMSGSILRVVGHTPPGYNPISASIYMSSSFGNLQLNDGHITASGNISASGNLEISSSLTFGDGIAQIIGPGNNDYIQLATDNIDIFINGAEVINVDNDSINFNVSNQDIDFNYTSDNGIPLIFGDAANNRVKLRDFVTIGSGSTPNADSNALLVSGSSQFIGHITASGNISASGDIIGTINGGNF